MNLSSYLIGFHMVKIPHKKLKISLEFAIFKFQFEAVTQISRSINPDLFEDNMKRNSDLRNTWSSCVMQMLKQQTRVKAAEITEQAFHNLLRWLPLRLVRLAFGIQIFYLNYAFIQVNDV